MKSFNIRFTDVDWGEDEARNDEMLDHYFVEFPGYENILKGSKRYIIGRKGTGKSAILQKIRLESIGSPTSFHTDISLRDFPLSDFKTMGDRSLQDKSKYVSAWKFLLLIEMASLIIQDNSIENNEEVDALRKLIDDNFPRGISVSETIKTLKQNENKIGISHALFQGQYTGTSGAEVAARIHYNMAVKRIEEIFERIHTASTFVLLIDELDEGYKEKNTNLNLVLLSLLRATDELYNFFKKCSIKCVPVLALRSDIFDNLEDNDLNKLDDHILRLSWTTSENSPWSLKAIVEKRIAATIREKYPMLSTTDFWSLIADEKSANKGLWQYMCILTLNRPRDIIKLLKYCSNRIKGSRLRLSDVQAVEEEYSNWLYREFRDEVQSFLPCWKAALNCLSEVAKGKGQLKSLVSKMGTNEEMKKWCKDNKKKPLDAVRILFDYSVIGCINEEGRWIFKYKDDYFEFMASYPYYCVHYGFCRKLRIPRSYDKTIVEVYRSYN